MPCNVYRMLATITPRDLGAGCGGAITGVLAGILAAHGLWIFAIIVIVVVTLGGVVLFAVLDRRP
jgi:hypothetical protein